MKITVKQLKALIRESVEETMEEMHGAHMEEVKEEGVKEEGAHGMEEALQEAVAKAFRAGFRKGRSTRR